MCIRDRFDAEVGLQPCGAGGGSVVFRVSVDGEKRFDSGILRPADGAKTVHVNVEGAQELRLDAGDGGDGITCDMANWADARLTRSDGATIARPPAVDMARFARVVTWDPDRKDGCRANRLQEFAEEDLFLETDLVREADGCYAIPTGAGGSGCIGLQWLNRRALRELRLRLSGPAAPSAVNSIRVEGWFGESAWQGQWLSLIHISEPTRLLSTSYAVFRLKKKKAPFPLVRNAPLQCLSSSTASISRFRTFDSSALADLTS